MLCREGICRCDVNILSKLLSDACHIFSVSVMAAGTVVSARLNDVFVPGMVCSTSRAFSPAKM